MNPNSNNVVRQGAVFPGHPVTLAYIIMQSYASLAEAEAKEEGSNFPNVLSNGDIPGTESHVIAGLNVLKYAKKLGLERAIAFGDDSWRAMAASENLGVLREQGQAQADSIKDSFRAKAVEWLELRAPHPA